MRPRVIPAENSQVKRFDSQTAHGFNEAAGNPRGKRLSLDDAIRSFLASMRPRVIPAENVKESSKDRDETNSCFNEAAGNPRGKLGVDVDKQEAEIELQ